MNAKQWRFFKKKKSVQFHIHHLHKGSWRTKQYQIYDGSVIGYHWQLLTLVHHCCFLNILLLDRASVSPCSINTDDTRDNLRKVYSHISSHWNGSTSLSKPQRCQFRTQFPKTTNQFQHMTRQEKKMFTKLYFSTTTSFPICWIIIINEMLPSLLNWDKIRWHKALWHNFSWSR